MDDTDAILGLRDRKKLETRRALSQAALRLAYERGLDGVRVEDIAAAANVSPRTFNNYFSSKEEAIVSLGYDRVERLRDALRARPAEEPLAAALAIALAGEYAGGDDAHRDAQMARLRLILLSPALRAEYLKATASVERALSEALAERMGVDLQHELSPHVLAAAICAAERAAVRFWLESGAKANITAFLRQALTLVIEGAPETVSKGGHVL